LTIHLNERKQNGSPLDMRTYYQVKIPSETNDGNVDLTIYSQTVEEGGKIIFKIGLEEKKYKVQVEELIKIFKKNLYIQFYLAELKLCELEAESIASEYASAVLDSKKDELLNVLTVKREVVEKLKEEVRKVESQ